MNFFQKCENGADVEIAEMIDMIETTYPDRWLFFHEDEASFIVFHSYQKLKKGLRRRGFDIDLECPKEIKGDTDEHQNHLENSLTEELGGSCLGRAFDEIIDELMKIK